MRKHDMFYFAYSTDMRTEKMLSICPEAVSKGTAYIPHHTVGLIKAVEGMIYPDILMSYGDILYGVLWELGGEQDYESIQAEHTGDQKQDLLVRLLPEKTIFQAFTFRGMKTAYGVESMEKMVQQMVSGAYEHNLPPEYIDYLGFLFED